MREIISINGVLYPKLRVPLFPDRALPFSHRNAAILLRAGVARFRADLLYLYSRSGRLSDRQLMLGGKKHSSLVSSKSTRARAI
jgi:hypothetical protein